jgi:hypothetical protein
VADTVWRDVHKRFQQGNLMERESLEDLSVDGTRLMNIKET